MPGYVMHIAIAQEYLRKFNIPYSIDFIKGTIAPDLVSDKRKTHYGASPSFTNLKKFLDENELNDDYIKGFFLHLITDYLFYNYYIDTTDRERLHQDYDCINKELIEKYNVQLVDEIKEKVYYKDEIPSILSKELACKVIDEVSNLQLKKVKEEVLNNEKKWNFYRRLEP